MEKLKMAIVGAGVWGLAHAAVFRDHPQVETLGICDLSPGRSAQAAADYGIPAHYTRVEDMLRDCPCDAVSIVTPDHLHAEPALLCAQAGKHILLEKPLATTHEDLEKILEAAAANRVRVMVDLHNRWSPPFAAAKQAIEAGELGQLQHGYFRLNDIKWVATDMLSWTAASSILWFLGSHSLDTLSWLFGSSLKRVYAVSSRGVLDRLGVQAPDTYLATLEYENGCIAQMENSWISPNGNPNINDIKCTVLGDKGMISIDGSHHTLIQKYTDQGTTVPDVLVRHSIHGRLKGFAYESIGRFVDSLLSNEDFIVPLEEAAAACRGILAIMESAETGLPVELRS